MEEEEVECLGGAGGRDG